MTIEIKVITQDKTEITFKKKVEHTELITIYVQHFIEFVVSAYKVRLASYYFVLKVMEMLKNEITEYKEMLGENEVSIELSE